MRSNAARAYSLLFFFSGATGLVYELLWVRILYQAFGSTIQSITTVVAAYMGGLGLGAWLLGRKADRHARPAALYGWLEIAIGAFGLASPFVLSLAHRVYIGAAGALALGGAASVALRFGLAALVLLVPTTLMGGTLPALTKGFMGVERDRLQTSLGRLYALNTLGAVVGTALAGFFLIERVGIRPSLYGTAALNLALGAAALALYVIRVFGHPGFDATQRLALLGLAVGAVVLIPAVGMGLSFPLIADLAAPRDAARGADVGVAYALNTLGSIVGAVLTGFVLVVTFGTETTLRLGLVINGLAALVLATLAARGVAEGSAEHRALRLRVLVAGGLGSIALGAAFGAPGWGSRLIDLGPTIYARDPMGPAARQAFLAHRGARQLAFREGWNATVSVWEGVSGRTLRVNGKVDASDQGDMDTQIMLGLAPAAARPEATSALVIGFGSGVTTRVLADVPGMRRVRVVEIEPAVLSVRGLFAPDTPLGGLSREWLGIDSVGDHFGRRLLDEAGVAQLAERGTLTHRDDRPELEFVAARRFLDPVWDSHVFDSLMDLEVRVGGHPGTTPVLLARAMTSPRIPSTQGPILEAAHRAQPDNPVWLVRVARMRFAAGDSAFADSVLPGLVRTRNPEALLFAAALAARRGDQRRRAALLREALARGGDTAETEDGLAPVTARRPGWTGTAAALRRSLASGRATYRHPFPAGLLHDPLAALALTGPIRLADSVLAAAWLAHPGWTTPYELRAAIALRDGRCDDAASQFLALAEFGIEVTDAPDRLMRCRGREAR